MCLSTLYMSTSHIWMSLYTMWVLPHVNIPSSCKHLPCMNVPSHVSTFHTWISPAHMSTCHMWMSLHMWTAPTGECPLHTWAPSHVNVPCTHERLPHCSSNYLKEWPKFSLSTTWVALTSQQSVTVHVLQITLSILSIHWLTVFTKVPIVNKMTKIHDYHIDMIKT